MDGAGIVNRIYDLLYDRRIQRKYFYEDCNISAAALSLWKLNKAKPSMRNLERIAAYLNTTVEYLISGEGQKTVAKQPTAASMVGYDAQKTAPTVVIGEALSKEFVRFSVVGRVAAGYDGLPVEENTGDYVYYPAEQIHGNPNDYFVLRVKGNSMYPKLIDGDTVLCKRVTSVDSGKIAVVIYNGEEATIKKVRYVYGENWLDLIPTNPEYETRHIEGRDIELCRVIGEVIKMQRDNI